MNLSGRDALWQRLCRLATIMITLAYATAPVPALAVNGTWINSSGGSWTTAGNWSGIGIADGADNTADFSTLDITADTLVTLDGTRTIGNLIFGDTTPSHKWILSTGTGDPLTMQVSSGNFTINVNNQTAIINAALAGSSPMTKLGAGTLVLGGANTYTGGTVISAGVIDVSSLNAFGGASDSGCITINASGTVITGSPFNLYAATSQNSIKNLIINGNAGFTNGITLVGGTSNVKGLSIGGTGTLTYGGVVTPYNGRMDLFSTATLILTNGGSITLTGNNGNQVLFASSASTLVIAGGSFSCTGNNGPQASVLGNLIINSGTASMGGPLSTYITMQAGTVLSLNGGTLAVQGISGQPSVTINYNGGTVAALLSTNSFVNPVITTNKVQAGGAVFDTGTNSIGLALALSHDGALGVTPDGGLTKLGTGMLTLSGTNTYTGPTIASAGTLRLGSADSISNSLGIDIATGAVLDVSLASGFTVVSNQILSGNGSVTGDMIIACGGILSPGGTNTAGLLTVPNLVLNAGAVYNWQYDSNTATGDVVVVTGTLNLPSTGTVNLPATTVSKKTHGVLFTCASCPQVNLAGWNICVNGVRCGGYIRNSGDKVEWILQRGTVVTVR